MSTVPGTERQREPRERIGRLLREDQARPATTMTFAIVVWGSDEARRAFLRKRTPDAVPGGSVAV